MTPTEGSGKLEERPPAEAVQVGFRWTSEDRGGEQHVSDGRAWVLDEANEPWTLKYAEDIDTGAWVRRSARVGAHMQQSGPFMFGSPGVEVTEFCQLLEKRQHDCTIAMILVRPDGEQIPYYSHVLELMQVRSEMPT
jgi:hypothetical protein